jgi:eukaryotic-like serine/threonine-protein kinase
MSFSANDVKDSDARLDEIIGAYLAAADSGQIVNRSEILFAHPDLASELSDFFTAHDRLEQAALPLRPLARAVTLAMPPQPGQSLAGYQLIDELGRGGMGIVYRARQKIPTRFVALKMIRSGFLASKAELRRFRTEAQAAASLDHANVVPIYEVGEYEGRFFYSMKLIEGESLARSKDSYRTRPREAARVIALVARAIHHAHLRGVLHRDLKPGNILLDRDGQPHVADFGLAKWFDGALADCADESGAETLSGMILGTPVFMAPEQALARPGASGVSRATDVHGLGAVLYTLLTGQTPFRGATMSETLEQVIRRDPPAPRSLNPLVDQDLQTVCLRCLEKDPPKRYASAEEVAEDLERWLGGESVRARPVGGLTRVWRRCRRHPRQLGMLAATALLLIALTITSVLLADRNQEARRQKEVADEQRVAALESERALRLRSYATDIQRAMRLHDEHQARFMNDLLAPYEPRADQEDIRGFEWYYLTRLGAGGTRRTREWLAHPKGCYAVCFLEDNRTLFTDGEDLHLRFWTVDGKEFGVPIRVPGGETTAAALTMDRARIATAGDDLAIRVWDVRTRGQIHVMRGHTKRIWSLNYSRDGKLLAATDDAGRITLWDPVTERQVRGWNMPYPVHQGIFSADGRTLVTSSGPRWQLIWWDLATTGVGTPPIRAGHDFVGDQVPSHIAAASDGQTFAIGDFMGNIRLYGQRNGEPVALWQSSRQRAFSLAYSWNSDKLAVGHNDGHVSLIEMPSGKQISHLVSHSGRVYGTSLSPDGKMLAAAGDDGFLRLWDTSPETLFRTTPVPEAHVDRIVFEPDGRTFFALLPGNSVLAFDTDALERLPDGHPFNCRPEPLPTSWPSPIEGEPLALSSDKKLLACRDTKDCRRLNVWEIDRRRLKCSSVAHQGILQNASFSPDGQTIATVGDDGRANLWQVATGIELLSLPVEAGAAFPALAFSPDGKALIAGGTGVDGKGRLWMWATHDRADPPKSSNNRPR